MIEACCGASSRDYAPGVTPQTHPELDRLAGYAIRYFDDFVKPTKVYRAPDEVERQALAELAEALGALPANADGEAIQNAALNVARRIERYQDHSRQSPEGGPGVSVAFFQMIYQVLIGQERGPRFGSFAALYGIGETRALIEQGIGRTARGLKPHQGDGGAGGNCSCGSSEGCGSTPSSVMIGWLPAVVPTGASGTSEIEDVSGGATEDAHLLGARLLLRHHVRAVGRSARPAVRHQPGTGILLGEAASGARHLMFRRRAIGRPGRGRATRARKAVRALTPHGQDTPS